MTTTSAARTRPRQFKKKSLGLTALLLATGSPFPARAQAPVSPVSSASPSPPPAPVSSASPAPAPALAPDPAPAFVPLNPAAPTPTVAPAPAPAPVAVATPAPAPPPPIDGQWVRRRTPRSIGLWLGWAWNPVNYLPMRADELKVKPHGASFVFDYGWQVGGLRPGGWPTYVGFILGTSFYPGTAERRHALTLEYGILVRHHLAPRLPVHPFLSYGLGAIQAFVFGVEGRGIGHLTRLGVGIEGKVSAKVRLALELIYKIDPIRAYRLEEGAQTKFDIHTVSAVFGVNFSL